MKARTVLDPSFTLDPFFTTRMAPVLLPWIYLSLVSALGVTAVALVIGAFVVAWWVGLIALVVVPVGAAGLFAVLRVACELVMDFARLPHVTQAMAAGLVRIESTVDGVAEDMPRIAFLRGPRKAASSPSNPQERLEA